MTSLRAWLYGALRASGRDYIRQDLCPLGWLAPLATRVLPWVEPMNHASITLNAVEISDAQASVRRHLYVPPGTTAARVGVAVR